MCTINLFRIDFHAVFYKLHYKYLSEEWIHGDLVPALFWTSSSKALGCMDFVLLRRPTISGVTACSGSTTGKRSSDTRFPLCRQLSTQSTDTRWIPFFIAFSRVVFLPSLKICLEIFIKKGVSINVQLIILQVCYANIKNALSPHPTALRQLDEVLCRPVSLWEHFNLSGCKCYDGKLTVFIKQKIMVIVTDKCQVLKVELWVCITCMYMFSK